MTTASRSSCGSAARSTRRGKPRGGSRRRSSSPATSSPSKDSSSRPPHRSWPRSGPLYVSLLLAPIGCLILLKAERRDAWWIVLSGVLAFGGARIGSTLFGAELGAFLGGFVVGWASGWYARLTNRPSQIMLVPGLLLLVPGCIGARSLASLLDGNVEVGVESAFHMVLIAVSLVSGILIANVVSPKRKLMKG